MSIKGRKRLASTEWPREIPFYRYASVLHHLTFGSFEDFVKSEHAKAPGKLAEILGKYPVLKLLSEVDPETDHWLYYLTVMIRKGRADNERVFLVPGLKDESPGRERDDHLEVIKAGIDALRNPLSQEYLVDWLTSTDTKISWKAKADDNDLGSVLEKASLRAEQHLALLSRKQDKGAGYRLTGNKVDFVGYVIWFVSARAKEAVNFTPSMNKLNKSLADATKRSTDTIEQFLKKAPRRIEAIRREMEEGKEGSR